MRKIITGLLVLAIFGAAWVELVEAADPAASDQSNQIPSSSAPSPGAQGGPAGAPSGQGEAGACCKVGDTTPPKELVAKVPPGNCIVPILTMPSLRRMTQISSSSSGYRDA